MAGCYARPEKGEPYEQLTDFCVQREQLRTVQRDDGLWWVLRDVCRVLGMSNPAMVAGRLDEDEKGVSQIYTPGGTQEITIVNEPGLYAVILRSDKPEAKAFKRWVTHDVLPSIRKTGAYGVPPERLAKLDEYQAKLDRNRKLLADIERITAQAGRQAHEARKCYDEWRKTREGIRDNVRFWEECIAQEIRQLSDAAVQ